MSHQKKTEDQRNVTIRDITNNRGPISINTGDTTYTHAEQAFSRVYEAINLRPGTSDNEKSDMKAEAAEVEKAVKEPEKLDENVVVRHLRNIKRMAPDIMEVALTAIFNTPAVPALISQKIAAKARET